MNYKEYFYFNPNTYIKLANNSIFLFNTNNQNNIKIKNKKFIDRVKNKIQKYNSAILLKKEDFLIIKELTKLELGSTFKSKTEPFIPYSNFVKIENNIEIIKKAEVRHLGTTLSTNVRELNFIFTNIFEIKDIKARQKLITKAINTNQKYHLFEIINNFLLSLDKFQNLEKIIFFISKIEDIEIIKDLILINKDISYWEIHSSLSLYMKYKKLYPEIILNLYIHDVNELKTIKSNSKHTFILNFSTQEAYQESFDILKKKNIKFIAKPIFDNNFSFFKKHVFINKTDILSEKNTVSNIKSNSIINKNDFGKIFIDSNGNCSTNIYSNTIANSKKDNLQKILLSCFESEKSTWFLTRNKVPICENCTFNELCPPISDYELILKKFNLCHIQ